MTSEPVSEHPLTQFAALHAEAHRGDVSELGSCEAERLLPLPLLNGCRQAIQRITTTEAHSFGITSATRGEGRSSVALGFGLVESLDHERRTVIVDLDFESPSLHHRLGVREGPGLTEMADLPNAAVEDYVQRVSDNVWLLSAGSVRDEAPRSLSRLAQSTVLSQLSEFADSLVFDLPPVLASSAGVEAARFCGTPMVMVVRAGVTPLPRVKEAVATLGCEPSIVLNGVGSTVPRWIRRAFGEPA